MAYHSKRFAPGTTNATPLSSTSAPASWVLIQAPVTNSNACRVFGRDQVSGTTVPAGGGTTIMPGGAFLLPTLQCVVGYNLMEIFTGMAANTDEFDLSWGTQ